MNTINLQVDPDLYLKCLNIVQQGIVTGMLDTDDNRKLLADVNEAKEQIKLVLAEAEG